MELLRSAPKPLLCLKTPMLLLLGKYRCFLRFRSPKPRCLRGFLHHGIYTVFWCQCLAKTPVSTHIYADLTMFQDVVSRDFLSSWRPLRNSVLNYFHLFLGTLLGNLFLRTLLWNLGWEPVPGNLVWEPAPGNLGTFGDGDFGCSDLLRDLYCG